MTSVSSFTWNVAGAMVSFTWAEANEAVQKRAKIILMRGMRAQRSQFFYQQNFCV
jgi:hypothetical protein